MKTLSALTLAALLALAGGGFSPAQAEGVRPEIGKHLQQAAEFLRAGKSREALAKVREAEAVSGKTVFEQLTIDRMGAAAAQRAGDHVTAIRALEGIYPKVSGAEAGQIAEQLAASYAQQRNTGKASEWLNKAVAAGNNSATVKQLQSYLQAASGDYAAIGKTAAAAVSASEQAGRRPDEGDLLRLADAQQRTNQTAGYVDTLEKLLAHYPKKDYWNAYLSRLPRKAGFADRFALDLLRLRLASGTLSKTDEFMEMTQLSLQAGLPVEALRIVEQGYKSGALGKGAEADRHQRLRDLAVKQEARAKAGIEEQAVEAAGYKDGNDLVKVGYAFVSMGHVNRGIELIQKGIAKGSLKHPEDGKLRLGMAQMQSPQTKSAGVQTLRSVRGNDGVADIARLWTILGN